MSTSWRCCLWQQRRHSVLFRCEIGTSWGRDSLNRGEARQGLVCCCAVIVTTMSVAAARTVSLSPVCTCYTLATGLIASTASRRRETRPGVSVLSSSRFCVLVAARTSSACLVCACYILATGIVASRRRQTKLGVLL